MASLFKVKLMTGNDSHEPDSAIIIVSTQYAQHCISQQQRLQHGSWEAIVCPYIVMKVVGQQMSKSTKRMYIRLDKRKEKTKAYGCQDLSSAVLASTLCEYNRTGFRSTSMLYQGRSQVPQCPVPVARRVTSLAFSQCRHYAWVHSSTVNKRPLAQ